MTSNNHRAAGGPQRQALLTFSLGTQLYALMIEDVVEVAPMVEMILVVDASPAFLGLVNRRGAVLPMLDLRVIFQQETTPINALTLFIVAVCRERMLGLVVDTVHQVEYVTMQYPTQAEAPGTYLQGVIPDGDRLIQIVSPAALLNQFASHEWTGEHHGS